MNRDRYEHLAALCEDGCVRTGLCRTLETAVTTLQEIATVDPAEDYRDTGSKTPIRLADAWLTANGYESGDTLRNRRRRERRADQLDAEIERLRAERAKL